MLRLLFLLPLVTAVEIKGDPSDPRSIQATLDSLPKECHKNGKTYKEGENFEIGRLRYKCQKYGVYSIEGCRTEKNEPLHIGQTLVKDNVAHQCLASGNSVYYKETVCGMLGQPDCDKVPKPSAFEAAVKKHQQEPHEGVHETEIKVAGLPQGWKVLEETKQKIPGTNATVVSRTLIFNPIDHSSRIRRAVGDIDTDGVKAVLDALPKECHKGGKTYKLGEDFEIGRLRYKCQKYGVYTIEGCRTEKNESMKIGETLIKDNLAHQCLASGNAVHYRETTCGILGQPDCDKVPKPEGIDEEDLKKTPPELKEIVVKNLPDGWKILDEVRSQVPGTNATIVSRTLIYNPHGRSRIRRAAATDAPMPKGVGVGRVIGMEDVGTDKPPMPMDMLMGGKKVNSGSKGHSGGGSSESNGHSVGHHSSSGSHHDGVHAGNHHSPPGDHHGKHGSHHPHGSHHAMPKVKTTTMQTLGAKLTIMGKGDHSKDVRYKPGTVGGSRSDVNWHGKTESINGKQMAVGPGTFTFGTSPTGAFVKKHEP